MPKLNVIKRYALSFSFVTLSFAAFASVNTNNDNQHARNLFKQAEKLTHKANGGQYKELYQQLHFYPLQPYLDQQRLMKSISIKQAGEISQFLIDHQGTPLDWPLRKKWLQYLAKKNYQKLFIEAYRTNGDAKLACFHLQAQLDNKVPASQVLPEVTDLWVVGKSQPKQCDKLFDTWKKAGYRTQDIIWQRVEKAADGGKHTLIPYLTKLLDQDQQYLATLWHKVRKNPQYIARLNRFSAKSEREAQILTYGLKRLIWRDPELALKTYDTAKSTFPFTDQQQAYITERFALALATKHHKDAKQWLTQVTPDRQKGQVIQWRMAQLLKTGDWQQIKQDLFDFPQTAKESLQWRYWYAMSLTKTGDNEQGQLLLANLAKERHYYGFLAASRVEQNIKLNHQPLEITAQERNEILSHTAGKRAFEWFYLGRFDMARKEWNYWQKQLDKRQRLVAAKVANEAGWFDRAIFSLAYEGYLNDVDLRFPLAYQNTITEQSNKNNISPPWAFAIARRESSFMSDAHSGAGARGLMQIMPTTARHIAKRPVSTRKLNNAEQNIALGTKYLSQLFEKHDQNQILATAAYNAGSSRIKKWLKTTPTLSADIWIETIPFKETRNYVKSVMAYQQIYREKTGIEASLFAQLIDMEIQSTQ